MKLIEREEKICEKNYKIYINDKGFINDIILNRYYKRICSCKDLFKIS